MHTRYKVIVSEDKSRERLDRILVACLTASYPGVTFSRSRIQALIKTCNVKKISDGKAKVIYDAGHKVSGGEEYEINLPPPEQAVPEAQNIPISVVYEDDDLLVIDKAAGMVVHPAAGNRDKTLVNALLSHCGKSLSGIGGVVRPGIVHRLDKDTSGLLVVAKHDKAHNALAKQFSDRSLSRVYQAIVWGVPAVSGEIEGNIGRSSRDRKKMAIIAKGGRHALTRYKLKEALGNIASLVECKLATGRTHQIRVHMASIKHPVVGDQLYCGRNKIKTGINSKAKSVETPIAILQAFPRQALHAVEISFQHPCTGKAMRFKSGLPQDIAALLKALRKSNMRKAK